MTTVRSIGNRHFALFVSLVISLVLSIRTSVLDIEGITAFSFVASIYFILLTWALGRQIFKTQGRFVGIPLIAMLVVLSAFMLLIPVAGFLDLFLHITPIDQHQINQPLVVLSILVLGFLYIRRAPANQDLKSSAVVWIAQMYMLIFLTTVFLLILDETNGKELNVNRLVVVTHIQFLVNSIATDVDLLKKINAAVSGFFVKSKIFRKGSAVQISVFFTVAMYIMPIFLLLFASS